MTNELVFIRRDDIVAPSNATAMKLITFAFSGESGDDEQSIYGTADHRVAINFRWLVKPVVADAPLIKR